MHGGVTIPLSRCCATQTFDGLPDPRCRARRRDRAVPRDGGADGCARARSGRDATSCTWRSASPISRRRAGDRRRAARDRGGRHLLHVGARACRRCARRSPATTRPLRRRRRAGAHHRHGRIVGGAAARAWRSSSIATSGSCSPIPGYPCNRHFVRAARRRAGRRSRSAPTPSYQLTAELVEQHWTPTHARRADRFAVQPDGHDGRARRDARASPRRSRRAAAGSIVDEIYLGLTYGDAAAQRARVRRTTRSSISSFSKYFNMTGWRLGWLVAPERHVRDLEKLAQNLYISPPTPSQRAALGVLRAGDARDRRTATRANSRRGAISSSRRCASWASASRSCPPAASSSTPTARASPTTASGSAATCSKARALLSRRASISARTAPAARALRLHDRPAQARRRRRRLRASCPDMTQS